MSAESDEAIARRIRDGGPAGFDAFFARFSAQLLGFLLRMVGDRAAAEDLLQETMLRVFRGIDRYEERGNFRAWVYRIAANLAVSHLRRARPFAAEPEALLLQVRDEHAEDPCAGLVRAEEVSVLHDGIAALPEEQRLVLLLRTGQGLSLAEIAAALCLPEGTVKSRLHNAVVRLRAHAERVERAHREGSLP